ncbi:uncharacterized protein LOC126416976 [Schistocerca serialis cubense]|uniref:uncharacterized protein LOC126416976 n=1 Tax=Schistocerca serialis cubense TaxID=2023355 RepID=UPI00214E042A|nr:uncharacterized protein LOC126416976 [Schistocerca serialis cubense]
MELPPSTPPAARPPHELEYLLRLLHWTGVLRHPRAESWAAGAYYLRSAAANAAVAAFLCSQALALWRGGTADIDRFTLLLSTFNTVAAWLFRLGHIAVHERQFHYLAAQVDRDFGDFLRPRDVHLMETHDQDLRRFVLAYIWFGTAGCLWWIVFPLLRFGFCAAGLPFILELPYDVASPLTFIPTWVFCSFITMHVTLLTIGVDSFNVSLIAQLRVQLILLSRNIVDLANEDQDLTSIKHMPSENSLSSDAMSGIQIRHQLRKMILHHQAIIRSNTEHTHDAQLNYGSCANNGAAYTIISAESLAEAGKFGCYLWVMLAQLFVYCWFGDEFITESEKVALATYSTVTSLQGIPLSQKRSLLLMMVRAQRPLRITAGGFFPLSRESFVSVRGCSLT